MKKVTVTGKVAMLGKDRNKNGRGATKLVLVNLEGGLNRDHVNIFENQFADGELRKIAGLIARGVRKLTVTGEMTTYAGGTKRGLRKVRVVF